jgi:hypothetical protein
LLPLSSSLTDQGNDGNTATERQAPSKFKFDSRAIWSRRSPFWAYIHNGMPRQTRLARSSAKLGGFSVTAASPASRVIRARGPRASATRRPSRPRAYPSLTGISGDWLAPVPEPPDRYASRTRPLATSFCDWRSAVATRRSHDRNLRLARRNKKGGPKAALSPSAGRSHCGDFARTLRSERRIGVRAPSRGIRGRQHDNRNKRGEVGVVDVTSDTQNRKTCSTAILSILRPARMSP